MSKWHGGKGSNPRPISDRKKFEDNWDRIFNSTTAKVHQDGFNSVDDEDYDITDDDHDYDEVK